MKTDARSGKNSRQAEFRPSLKRGKGHGLRVFVLGYSPFGCDATLRSKSIATRQ
ncbi:hypothetical protein J5226_16955 [Lysobacter sp. K5869]|uniref:hypothetical protein n=1 Tax=Lysobacter sp. K5869 TaxID=2820808 RepID=UPI001C05EFF2|nr:hypothetical protein [Lysobacter sp. K5869]QWP75307.1 hypothetical protein J5226_16955 [Lysobacter sp. K5869]